GSASAERERGHRVFRGDARSDPRSSAHATPAGAGHPEPGKLLRRGILAAARWRRPAAGLLEDVVVALLLQSIDPIDRRAALTCAGRFLYGDTHIHGAFECDSLQCPRS